jgi:arylformamidase
MAMRYRCLDAEQLEQQYNLIALRPDFHTAIAADWERRSAALRDRARARLGLRFSDDPRDLLDLFLAGSGTAPVIIFIHGGYWQRGTKEMYSFIAEPFIANGIAVAVLDYNLCPTVRLPEIAPQIRRAMAWLWRNARALGFAADKMILAGASAGGHLTAMMLATDWPGVAADLPPDLVKAAVPISGIYDLEPIVHTSINHALGMDLATARQESPLFMRQPVAAPQLVAVGGAETAEFVRQSDEYHRVFCVGRDNIERHDEPDVDHFDILNRLSSEHSQFFQKTVKLIATSLTA